MSNAARIAIVVVAAAGLVIAFFAASSSDDQDEPPAATQTVAQTAPTDTTATSATETTPPETTATTGVPPEPAPPLVDVKGGKPVGGVERLTFRKGDQVRFRVRADVSEEVHVHGYDVAKDVTPGRAVTFSFKATIEGRFEIELEHAGVEIAQLEVRPS